VFCTKCGAQNVDGAAFCSSCGASLSAATQSAPAMTSVGSEGMAPAKQRAGKNPFVAAFLNLIFGLGYVYLGTKKVLGVPTIAFVFLVLLLDIVLGTFSGGIVSFVFAIILAIDGWQKAKGGKGYISAEY
jgi:hypothetical protein